MAKLKQETVGRGYFGVMIEDSGRLGGRLHLHCLGSVCGLGMLEGQRNAYRVVLGSTAALSSLSEVRYPRPSCPLAHVHGACLCQQLQALIVSSPLVGTIGFVLRLSSEGLINLEGGMLMWCGSLWVDVRYSLSLSFPLDTPLPGPGGCSH